MKLLKMPPVYLQAQWDQTIQGNFIILRFDAFAERTYL